MCATAYVYAMHRNTHIPAAIHSNTLLSFEKEIDIRQTQPTMRQQHLCTHRKSRITWTKSSPSLHATRGPQLFRTPRRQSFYYIPHILNIFVYRYMYVCMCDVRCAYYKCDDPFLVLTPRSPIYLFGRDGDTSVCLLWKFCAREKKVAGRNR